MIKTTQSNSGITDSSKLGELRRRMGKPQRHRLLHGYPLAAAMPSADDFEQLDIPHLHSANDRALLIGVLPHTCCNTAIKGCGFCTFPNEPYRAVRVSNIVDHVVKEIQQRIVNEPELHRRPVTGLYFGGGTANLTPPKSFRTLCKKLNAAFDFSGAEVTLEGVPAYFIKREPLLIDILRQQINARHLRISMGIQTFDQQRLQQMGRLAFGTRKTFRKVVELAQSRDMTVSADLLFNLPGQTQEEMLQDVQDAIAIGLDHIGLYHLVMFKGLGTVWSRDTTLLASLPPNNIAASHWGALRELLLGSGFTQTTLTNFERAEFQGDRRRFVYEESSFQPECFDMLGFGPSGISFTAENGLHRAVKTLNPKLADDYITKVKQGGRIWDRFFVYEEEDSKIAYLTRRLAALKIDRSAYDDIFASDVIEDFSSEFEALQAERLVEVTTEVIRPTPRGMFYADSIASLWAARRTGKRYGWSRGGNDSVPIEGNSMQHRPYHAANDNSIEYM